MNTDRGEMILASIRTTIRDSWPRLMSAFKGQPPQGEGADALVLQFNVEEGKLTAFAARNNAELHPLTESLVIAVPLLQQWYTDSLDRLSDEAFESVNDKIVTETKRILRDLCVQHSGTLEGSIPQRVLFTDQIPCFLTEQLEVVFEDEGRISRCEAATCRTALDQIIRQAGQFPEYCLLDVEGRVLRVVLFGESYTDKTIATLLELVRSGELCDEVIEWRFVATRISLGSVARIRAAFPKAAINVVTNEEWLERPDLASITTEY